MASKRVEVLETEMGQFKADLEEKMATLRECRRKIHGLGGDDEKVVGRASKGCASGGKRRR
ncbi:hypothetical protein MA16_Dca029174 [Dendrobium catenatum]|uniref:Uncharacterized protein n=1 Tax=Dendrobium catenatum TaxID=906689 RepID=A0A2I0V7E7_9ASPA|nr:hypothetical protein MA16_Dca029174 [Dendrobium catenatum]